MKRILVVILLLVLIAAGVGTYMWNKPHKKVENETGLKIDASQLSKEYGADEKAADAKYLNKAIEVKGIISEVEKNQDGGAMVVLQGNDATSGVECAMRDKGAIADKGKEVVIAGFCSGNNITGVSLTDCVLKK